MSFMDSVRTFVATAKERCVIDRYVKQRAIRFRVIEFGDRSCMLEVTLHDGTQTLIAMAGNTVGFVDHEVRVTSDICDANEIRCREQIALIFDALGYRRIS